MTARTPVVTGLGVVSAAGIGATHFWQGLRQGTPRFREVSLFPTDDLANHVAGEIGPWTPGFDALDADRLDGDRTATFALAALDQAIADAGLGDVRPGRVLVGTTVGDVADHESARREAVRSGAGRPGALDVDTSLRTRISRHLGGSVPVELFVTACAAGNMALIRAAQLVAEGSADVVVCGGAEALSRMAFTGFSRMRGMARERCRPFSDARDGLLLGEGSAFLIVESAAHAAARGAPVRATIAGYGLTCDAKHPAAPDLSGDGVARAMRSAIAGADPSDVAYVCAHGTGTPQNDAAEAAAYRTVFTGSPPPISSIKALIGHSLGAASAIEAVACTLVLAHQQTIPQWGLDDAGTSLGVRPATGGRDEAARIDLVLNNAFAFGGNNTCVGLRRPAYEEATA
ncbi:beta-ketoacyl-[acyl-carrier-protein] synthase family protein [Micromonospora sp. NPDC049900]|uniref:beta-ketoacyl-[acyl-carrier-protein] synthase family protein n=1 Tax=Micromonospora sp. NPDC049900 TaxID=3364275 RepID=UPI0037B8EA7D